MHKNATVKGQTLVSLLETMNELYKSGFTKIPKYKELYEEYVKRLFSKEVTLEEIEKAKNFLHRTPYSIGLNGFKEAMRIHDAKEILQNRDFFQKRMYILATLPAKEEEYESFLEKVEVISKGKKDLSQYICINIWEDYQKSNPLKNFLLGSYKTTKGSFSLFSIIGNFDDHGTLPSTNYSFIDLLKGDELPNLSSVIFITDDPRLSAYLLGHDHNYSDHPNPAISQVLKENCVDTFSLKYGHGTIVVLDFLNKNFECVA